MCFSPQRRAIFLHLNFKKWSEPDMFCTFSLQNVLLATAACNFSTSQLQKVVRTWHVLYIFTSKCASRHSGVQFFNISTSKSGPNLTCFVHFHFKMCFSPQRRAIFQHLNFEKWSGADVFCTFSLQNVLLATAACNFWFLLWPHDSAPAALTSLFWHTNHWKNTAFRDFSNIWRACIFFLLTLAQFLLSFVWSYFIFGLYFLLTLLHLSAFQLSILSEVYYLNFLRWYVYVESDCECCCLSHSKCSLKRLKNGKKHHVFWNQIKPRRSSRASRYVYHFNNYAPEIQNRYPKWAYLKPESPFPNHPFGYPC